MASGRRSRTSAAVIVRGTISENTCASRTRRAISWAYWAPKSTTQTWSWVWAVSSDTGGRPARRSAAHPDALRPLQGLALGLQRRCHHHLGLLEFPHARVAARRHRRAQGAEEV